MAPRRKGATPFEVMGQAARKEASSSMPPSTPAPPSGNAPHDTKPASTGAGWASPSDWWARTGGGAPLVLRVPRGLAVLAVAGLVGLLVLAYWVGHSRGVAAETARHELTATGGAPAMRTPPAGRATPGNRTASQSAGRQQQADADPREPERWYLVLVAVPAREAESLAQWLQEEHGVATVIQNVQNSGLRELIAVDRGFQRDELYTSEPYREYTARLGDIGRAWQRQARSRVNPFESRYPRLYRGPETSADPGE